MIGRARARRRARRAGGAIDPVQRRHAGRAQIPQPAVVRAALARRTAHRRRRAISPSSRSRSTASARAASTTISAAASPATRSTSAGWCRTSRRCCTTTRSCSSCSRSPHLRTRKPLYRARARETVDWLAREMTRPDGGFCASLDADSEGEEGRFYVWSLAEIERILGPEDAAFFAAHYDVSTQRAILRDIIFSIASTTYRAAKMMMRKLAMLRIHAACGAQQTDPPRARRQGPGRLERDDDRRPGQCRHGPWTNPFGSIGRAAPSRSSPTR